MKKPEFFSSGRFNTFGDPVPEVPAEFVAFDAARAGDALRRVLKINAERDRIAFGPDFAVNAARELRASQGRH